MFISYYKQCMFVALQHAQAIMIFHWVINGWVPILDFDLQGFYFLWCCKQLDSLQLLELII